MTKRLAEMYSYIYPHYEYVGDTSKYFISTRVGFIEAKKHLKQEYVFEQLRPCAQS